MTRKVLHLRPYLLVGSGKLSTHIQHYFNLLGYGVSNWNRQSSESFAEAAAENEKIFLLISDDQINTFYSQYYEALEGKQVFHCSGALYHEEITGIHPLMAFSHELFSLDDYKKINFAVDRNLKLKYLVPEFENNNIYVREEDKAFYHSLCVMSANIPTIIWESCYQSFAKLGVSKESFNHYLKVNLRNFINLDAPLTGPISRGDDETMKKNIESLVHSPMAEIYKTSIQLHNQLRE